MKGKNVMTQAEKMAYFTSQRFVNLIQQFVRNYCKNSKLIVRAGDVTCTDGKIIFINFATAIYLSKKYDKTTTMLCYLGNAFHENAHLEESCFEILWAIAKDDFDSSFLTTKEKLLIQNK